MPRLPDKEYNATLEHIYQNVRAYLRIKKYVFINDYENIIAYSEVRKVSATSGQCCLRRIFLLSLKKI